MTPRVLLLATTTGYQTRAFGEAADRLGVELAFATDRCHVLADPWQDGAIPIRFHQETESVQAILAAANGRPFDGIIAVGDRPTVVAARAAEALGLPGHPPDAAAAARDKRRTRERLRNAGLPTPWFLTIPAEGAGAPSMPPPLSIEVPSFPCVVKPLALSGSRGVIRADDRVSLERAIARVRALLRSPDIRVDRNPAHEALVVEGYVPGTEHALEAVLVRGRLKVLALFDKPDPLEGPFFEETIYVTPSSLPVRVQDAVVHAVASAADALRLHHGPVHAECRVNPRGVVVLEVAARPVGGLCARALRFTAPGTPAGGDSNSAGADTCSFEELLLRFATGQSIACWHRESPASGVMMMPIPGTGVLRGVSGLERARAVEGVDDVIVTAKTDQRLVPLPEGASYLGFVFAHGSDTAAVERSLRTAHARLHFAIDPDMPVVQSRHG